jgi:hypothetical protein
MKLTKYGPKGNLSPSIGDPCRLCGAALMPGDYTTLVARNARSRYANDGVEVHWDCATKQSSAVSEPR